MNGLRSFDQTSLSEAAKLPPLPYSDLAFSQRVLGAHLDQTTDQASRRIAVIRQQVEWLRRRLPARVLRGVFHPLCGPGLFAAALLDAGTQTYVGIDIAPSAIEYARAHRKWPPTFDFRHADAFDRRAQPTPGSATLALLTYETLNAFEPPRAARLLRLLRGALAADGLLVAEVRVAAPRPGTIAPRSVELCPEGSLFESAPHLLLTEWAMLGADAEVMGHRFIVLREDGETAVHYSLVWRYDRARLSELATLAGFGPPVVVRSPTIESDHADVADDRFAIWRVTRPRSVRKADPWTTM